MDKQAVVNKLVGALRKHPEVIQAAKSFEGVALKAAEELVKAELSAVSGGLLGGLLGPVLDTAEASIANAVAAELDSVTATETPAPTPAPVARPAVQGRQMVGR